jgi:hypothetical protein
MGIKLAWVGLTIVVISNAFKSGSLLSLAVMIAGAIIMTLGTVLICLDK